MLFLLGSQRGIQGVIDGLNLRVGAVINGLNPSFRLGVNGLDLHLEVLLDHCSLFLCRLLQQGHLSVVAIHDGALGVLD